MADHYKVTPKGTIDEANDAFVEIKETDIAEVGQAAMAGDAATIDDFIIKPGGEIVSEGGDFQLAGGLNINIYKPLRCWRGTDGKQFSDFDPAVKTLTLAPADSTNPRIDLIYALLTEDADAGQETRHAKKDPADADSAEADVSVYTEKRNTLSINKVTGTPATSPAVPALPANSAPLYYVIVPTGATVLTGDNIIDARHNFDTLEEVNERLAILEGIVNTLQQQKHHHKAGEVDIEAGAGRFAGLTEQQAWNLLGSQSDGKQNDPIVRPEILTPELAPYTYVGSNACAGKLGSAGDTESGTPVVDMPVGRQVSFFGGAVQTLTPNLFPAQVAGINLLARFFNKNVNQATNSFANSLNLSLASISAIQSDGGGAFELQGYALPVNRFKNWAGQVLTCAFSATKIVVAGGGAGLGDAAFYEVDTVGQTVTQRVLSGDVPNGYLKAVLPCGDGVNVIVAQRPSAVNNNGKLEWFKVNMSTLVSVKFTGTAPGYTASAPGDVNSDHGVIGDLVAPNLLLILVNVTGDIGYSANAIDNVLWFYHVDTNTFESFTPVGQNPLTGLSATTALQDVDLCCLESGKALLVRGRQIATHVFDTASRTWTKLNISNPTSDLSAANPNALQNLSVSNVNGRVLLSSAYSSIWEYTPGATPKWDNRNLSEGLGATGLGRGAAGLVGLISGGLPVGAGYLLGGLVGSTAKKDIWKWGPGGIIQAACGLTLGAGTNQASFVIDDGQQLGWQVAKVIGNPIGVNLIAGSIKLEVSFDNGAWAEVTRDVINSIVSAGSNPVRRWRVTLFGSGSNKPCISKLNENFESAAGPGFTELVLRFNYNASLGTRYLYVDRTGVVTLETTAAPSTPDKCLLMKITPNGSSAPTPFDYLNRRWFHIKKTTTRASGSTPAIANDLAVLPSFIRAYLKESDGTLKDKADPTIAFNTAIAITLASDGQSCILEMAG
ncbi:MAG: hypothetical protein HY231_23895 [Acidobacteria bacterium]|nr:hypothetical protein [Acidobacteriota bacterium]